MAPELDHTENPASEGSTPDGDFSSSESLGKSAGKKQEILVIQKKQYQYMTERPGDWLGGGGEEETESKTYFQRPKTKLRASWLGDKGTDYHTEAPAETKAAVTSPINQESPKKRQPDKWESKLKNNHREVLVLQKKKNQFLTERPVDWLGGEQAEASTHIHHHKTKLKASWRHDESMSQSLRNLSIDSSDNDAGDPLHASESNFILAKKERRQTSPMILQKLSLLKQKSEDNHKANDELVRGTVLATPAKAGSNAVEPVPVHRVGKIKSNNANSGTGNESLEDQLNGPKGNAGIESISSSNLAPTGQRRKTSPMILAKLSGLSQLNEEVHKKNEQIAVFVTLHHKVSSPPRTVKGTAAGRQSSESPFVLQNPLVNAEADRD